MGCPSRYTVTETDCPAGFVLFKQDLKSEDENVIGFNESTVTPHVNVPNIQVADVLGMYPSKHWYEQVEDEDVPEHWFVATCEMASDAVQDMGVQLNEFKFDPTIVYYAEHITLLSLSWEEDVVLCVCGVATIFFLKLNIRLKKETLIKIELSLL